MALEALKKALNGNLKDNKSIPFWSWNNALDEKELIKQIEDMHAAGIGGFIMHARTGLKDEYLSEKWWSCIGACLKKAKELDMNAWAYDENGWPSGFVGGKLLENMDFRARFLSYKQTDFYDEEAFVVYAKTENGYERVGKENVNVGEYHCVYLHISPANTDILKPEVVDAFIKETHEKYYERFADSFGKELVGFFTDEPQYYRAATPYSVEVEKAFTAKGKDVKDGLIWLFKQEEGGYDFRTEYYRTMNELYLENFYKKLYDWCEAHGCKLTGHSIEECSVYQQMYGGAGCMPTYEYEHIPGVDFLGRNCATELSPKQVGSVAAQLGKKYVLTETFACGGHDTTPKELKSIADFQYFNGVNMTCQHLYPYSLSAQGKFDHPPFFGPQSNWFKEFKEFNDYFTRLGHIVSNTEDRYDVAILHPLRNVYLGYIFGQGKKGLEHIEDAFNELLLTLRKNGVTYQFIDETLLKKYGRIDGDALWVGNCKYDKIIIPKIVSIGADTYDIFKQYAGKLCMLSEITHVDGKKATVDLQSNVTLEELIAGAAVKFYCEDGKSSLSARSSELGDFLFIKNYSREESSKVCMRGVAEQYKALNLSTLEVKNISNEITLDCAEGLILIKDETAEVENKTYEEKDITKQFDLTGIGENYLLLDYVSISRGGEPFSEYMPVPQANETLLREDYKGKLYVKQRFNVQSIFNARLMVEKAKYIEMTLNGKELSFEQSDFDVNFQEANIGDCLQVGENVLAYSIEYYQHDGVSFSLFHPLATESLRNCLYFDTSIENTYIKGDFIVNEDMSLSARQGLPCINSELYKNGYPFFKGEITLEGVIEKPSAEEVVLDLQGRFLVANVFVNGKQIDFVTETKKDIGAFLTEEKNEVVIKVKSSLRNLMGPHHFEPCAELTSVAPYHFTLRGSWKDGLSPRYTHTYNVVPFGVDKILLKERN